MSGAIHQTPGRLRARTTELKHNPERALAVREALRRERGIRSAEVNVLTGSLLVYYDAKVLNVREVLALIENRGKLCLEPEPAQTVRPLPPRVLMWAIEKAVERSIPLLLDALL